MTRRGVLSERLSAALTVATERFGFLTLAEALDISSSALRRYCGRSRVAPPRLARRIARLLRARARELDRQAARLEKVAEAARKKVG